MTWAHYINSPIIDWKAELLAGHLGAGPKLFMLQKLAHDFNANPLGALSVALPRKPIQITNCVGAKVHCYCPTDQKLEALGYRFATLFDRIVKYSKCPVLQAMLRLHARRVLVDIDNRYIELIEPGRGA